MIRFFRRYQKTVFGILIFLAALLMISFNVDFSNQGGSKSSNAAIKIDDIEIPHSEFYSRKREIENRYRQMFGAQYEVMAKQFNLNVAQNVVDSMIDETLMLRDASNKGFQASDEEIVSEITRLFPGGYDPSALRASGKTPEMFLRETEDQIRRGQLEDVLKDASSSSRKEAVALWAKQNTQFDVQYVEIDPKSFVKDVKAPSQEELKTYFDNHKEEFKLPERISYDYVAFKPDSFLKEIEVSEDEVGFYYTENQSKYENPEQLKLRHIQFLYPKENDPKKMATVKDKAQEAYEKAKNSQDFAALVTQYSDDITTKSTGGDLGWVARGKRSGDFDEKTYKVKDGGLAELIETDTGFEIVKVEGYKEGTLKALAEVKGEIEAILKKEQAPAYADTKARDFYDLVTKSDKTIAELAKEKSYVAASSNGLLAAETDPDPGLAGLTAKLLEGRSEDRAENPIIPKQLIELKDITVIVDVKEYKTTEFPQIETIKDKIVASYTATQSINLAKTKAEAVLASLKAGAGKLLEGVAKESSIELKKQSGISMASKLTGPLNGQEVRSEIFAETAIPSVPQKAISEEGKFYIVQKVKMTLPDEKSAKPETITALQQQNSQSLGMLSTKAYAGSLKASSQVNVDQAILNTES